MTGKIIHVHQVQWFIDFHHHYQLQFIHPAPGNLCYYIAHLTTHFTSGKSMCNYISGVWFLHKQLGLAQEALDSFPITSLLRTADLTMQAHPLHHLPVLPYLICQLYLLPSTLGPLGPAMKVCLAFRLFAMLRQSKLAPSLLHHFDSSGHTCRGIY